MTRPFFHHLRVPGVALLVAALTSGCLGHVYEIPRPELERLLQTPPPERGQSVFAVQQFTLTPDPSPAPAWEEPEGTPPPGYACNVHGYWVPVDYVSWGEPIEVPRAFHRSSPVVGGGSVGSGSHGAASGGSTSASKGGGGGVSLPKDGGALMAAVVVVGLAVGVGLVASEGVRYDGTVAVHPHHPIHLVRGTEERVVGLDELGAEALEPNVKALLVGNEGAGLWLRDRAPLNRQGFSFQFAAGTDALALPGGVVSGLGWQFGLGVFPTKWLGLLANTRLLSNTEDNSYRNIHLGLEAQLIPIALWRLHLGAFGGVGESWYASAGSSIPPTDGSREYVSFGGLAEFDLTTHLAITFRYSQDWLPHRDVGTPAFSSAWFAGLAVY